ncbi:MAG: hypothetical protein ACLTKQ_07135 [Acutalibacteraceae bacterium]
MTVINAAQTASWLTSALNCHTTLFKDIANCKNAEAVLKCPTR